MKTEPTLTDVLERLVNIEAMLMRIVSPTHGMSGVEIADELRGAIESGDNDRVKALQRKINGEA